MDNDDPINKLIDAKNVFRLKKINDQRAEQGLSPMTMKDLMLRDIPIGQEAEIVSPSFGGNVAKLAEENKRNQEALKGTSFDIANWRKIVSDKGLTRSEMDDYLKRYIKNEAANAQTYASIDAQINDLIKEFEKLPPDSFERRLQAQKIDELVQKFPSETLSKATINPDFNSNVLDFQEAKTNKTFKEINEILDSLDEKTLEKVGQSSTRKNPYAQADSYIAEQSLKDLQQKNPLGKISVGYGDFRNPLEKAVDYVKQTPISEMAMDVPKTATKALRYIAPPLAALDLGQKIYETSTDPVKASQEAHKKGIAQDLAEIGLDVSALGAPVARLAGNAALGAGLDIAALPLGGYLLGKHLVPGNEPYDPSKYPVESEDRELTAPTIVPPEQDMDKMYNYSKIKNLLKK